MTPKINLLLWDQNDNWNSMLHVESPVHIPLGITRALSSP
jgi:hypothetical protein